MLLVRRLSITHHAKRIILNQCKYATFTARDFLYDDSHGEVGTLNTRFIKHIAMELMNKNDKIIKQTIKYADYFPISDIRNFAKSLNEIPTEQLPRLIIFAYTYKTNGDPQKLSFMINEIDHLATRRLNEFDINGLLNMLYAFTYLLPNKITKLQFYKNSMYKLINDFNKRVENEDRPSSISREQFVQICYYLGLWKKSSESTQLMKQFLMTHLSRYIDKLDKVNFAIIANSAFKTSCLQSNEIFTKHLINEFINCDYKDDALLITLIKSLRLERISITDEIQNKLKRLVIENKLKNYHFKGIIHIFAYYSDNLWNDEEICSGLINLCNEKLKALQNNDELFNDIREKDIATFLWCLANLRCNYSNKINLIYIEKIILSRLQSNKYKYCPDELIDSVLSLWILNYKSEKLISPHILNLYNLIITKNNDRLRGIERVKLDSRLKLLINCIQIENPNWLLDYINNRNDIFNENRPVPEYLLKGKDNLQRLYEFLSENKDKLYIKEIKLILPILELNIPNIKIEMENNQKLHVEVPEVKQMLKFDNKESSLVHLKTRLLRKLDCNVILVKPNEITTNNDDLLTKLQNKFQSVMSESTSPQKPKEKIIDQ